jgi:hypothetical protein
MAQFAGKIYMTSNVDLIFSATFTLNSSPSGKNSASYYHKRSRYSYWLDGNTCVCTCARVCVCVYEFWNLLVLFQYACSATKRITQAYVPNHKTSVKLPRLLLTVNYDTPSIKLVTTFDHTKFKRREVILRPQDVHSTFCENWPTATKYKLGPNTHTRQYTDFINIYIYIYISHIYTHILRKRH